jgi:hypothetical protein
MAGFARRRQALLVRRNRATGLGSPIYQRSGHKRENDQNSGRKSSTALDNWLKFMKSTLLIGDIEKHDYHDHHQ